MGELFVQERTVLLSSLGFFNIKLIQETIADCRLSSESCFC